MPMSAKVSYFFNLFIRLLVLIVSALFVYQAIIQRFDTQSFVDLFSNKLSNIDAIVLLVIVAAFTIINWSIEIVKWKYITGVFSQTPLMQCVKGVLSGITISMFLPNRMGDVAGKVFWLKKEHRWHGFFSNVYSSISQVIATIVFATVGFVIFDADTLGVYVYLPVNEIVIDGVVVLLLLIALLFYFFLSRILVLFKKSRKPKIKAIIEQAAILKLFSLRKLTVVLMLSMLRFFVYSIQFALLCQIFGLNILNVNGLLLIAVMYFCITVVPQFAIAEIATRGAIALIVFAPFLLMTGLNQDGGAIALLSASSTLWLFNLCIPAIVGLGMLPPIKISQMRKK